jgi:hypothetical protein
MMNPNNNNLQVQQPNEINIIIFFIRTLIFELYIISHR